MNDTANPQTPEAPPTTGPEVAADWQDMLDALREDPTGDPVADAQDAARLTELLAAYSVVRSYLDETDGSDVDVLDYVDEVGGDTANEGEIDGAIVYLYNATYPTNTKEQ